MTCSTPAPLDPTDPAAPAIPTGLGLNELSEAEFQLLISQGQTLTIGQLNMRLHPIKVDAASLIALGITTRQHRRAVHMAAAGFRSLCDKLLTHMTDLKNAHSPGWPVAARVDTAIQLGASK